MGIEDEEEGENMVMEEQEAATATEKEDTAISELRRGCC